MPIKPYVMAVDGLEGNDGCDVQKWEDKTKQLYCIVLIINFISRVARFKFYRRGS